MDPAACINYNMLAAQSVYAKLVVERRATKPTKFQERTLTAGSTRYYATDDDFKPVTSVRDADDYTITSLSPTKLYMPINCIYSTISVVHADKPDFRFIKVEGFANDPATNTVLGCNLTVIDPNVLPTSAPTARYRVPLVNNALNTLPDGSSVNDLNGENLGDTSVRESLLRLGKAPLDIPLARAKNVIKEDMLEFEMELARGDGLSNRPMTIEEAQDALLSYLSVDEQTIEAVLTKRNRSMNVATVRVGLAMILLKSLTNAQLQNLSENLLSKLAESIRRGVDKQVAMYEPA